MSLWVVDYSLNAQLVCLTRKSQVYAHTGWSCVDQTRVDLWAVQKIVIQPCYLENCLFGTPVLIFTDQTWKKLKTSEDSELYNFLKVE